MKPSERFRSLVQYWAERADLPWEVVERQMIAESGGNPRAKSPAGAMGLLQLMPLTAREVGCEDPYNPDDNIKGATLYLAQQKANILLVLGSVPLPSDDVMRLSLAAFNCGFGYVRTAMKTLLSQKRIPTWQNVAAVLPSVIFKGTRPDFRQTIQYVERICPSVQAASDHGNGDHA